jgi:hypothetical protein
VSSQVRHDTKPSRGPSIERPCRMLKGERITRRMSDVCVYDKRTHREVLRIDPFLNNPRARLRRRDPNVKFPVRNRNHTICPQVVPLVPGFADARSSDRLFWDR